MKVWLNGSLVELQDAAVPVTDHGFLVGDGVFETLRCYSGKPFALREHLERLERGARALGLPEPPHDELGRAVEGTVAANRTTDARVRVTFTSGPGPGGPAHGAGPPTLLVTVSALPPSPATASLLMSPWPRNERAATAGVKTTSNAENVLALAYAKARGADEALFLNLRRDLCEGASSNVFLVRDGAVETPPLSSGCLAGITRTRVLGLCREFGIAAYERDLPAERLEVANEIFITSVTREVQAVARVDGRRVGDGRPGPVAACLAAAFRPMVHRELGL